MTRRYYHPDLPTAGGLVSLSEAELQHARVMRLAVGDTVELFDGKGNQSIAKVIEVSRKTFACTSETPQSVDRESPRRLHLGIALPKPDRARELIERLTELGVATLTPIIAARTQTPTEREFDRKIEAWRDRGMQTIRPKCLLEIREPTTYSEFLQTDFDGYDRWIAHPNGTPIGECQSAACMNIVALIGPEGGWTDDEVEQGRAVGYQKNRVWQPDPSDRNGQCLSGCTHAVKLPDFEDIASDRTVFHANDSAVPKTDVSHSFPLETIQMWRSMFVALGIMALIFGIECLMIDSAVLYSGKETTAVDFFDPTSRPADLTKTWQPSEWMPWAILSIGAVVVLYSFTLPRRFRNNVAVGA